jgi:hypothetical protein
MLVVCAKCLCRCVLIVLVVLGLYRSSWPVSLLVDSAKLDWWTVCPALLWLPAGKQALFFPWWPAASLCVPGRAAWYTRLQAWVHPCTQGVCWQHLPWRCPLAWPQLAYGCVIICTYSGLRLGPSAATVCLGGWRLCRLWLRPLLLAGVVVALAATVTDTWQPCAGHGQ